MTNDTASEKDFDQNKINEKALLTYQDKFSKYNLLLKLQHYGRDIGPYSTTFCSFGMYCRNPKYRPKIKPLSWERWVIL